jgi:hypothetical protein
VPRRKTPLAPKGQLLFLDYAAALYAGDMAGIIAAVRACSATRNLPQSLKHTLLFDLGGTVVFAKIGVRPWLSGRTVKPMRGTGTFSCVERSTQGGGQV